MPLQLRFGSRQLNAPWWAVLLALAAAVLFTELGRWQWHRAAYKQSLIGAFNAASHATVSAAGADLEVQARYTVVRVHGHYDGARQFLLDNLTRDGVAGYEVLTPLRLDSGDWVLVNRGWLPMPERRRDRLPDLSLRESSASQSVAGRLDHLPVTGLARGDQPPELRGRWPKRTSFPTMPELSAALGAPLPRWQLLLSADQPDGFRRDWHPTVAGFGPERHLAYALQWWGLAALSLIVLLVVNTRKSADEI